MKTDALAIHINRNPSDGFYHTENQNLFAKNDTIGNLADCPFPIQTDSFKVLLFGDCVTGPPPHTPGKFALVEYRKACGHMAHDRVQFQEGVQNFESHGTKFLGESYSIKSWESRIEYFRQTLCPVCDLYEHCRWAHFHAGERTASRRKTLDRFALLMDANFSNWKEFVSSANFTRAIQSPEDKTLSLRHSA